MIAALIRDRKARSVNDETARLRAACAWLWQAPYLEAVDAIRADADAGDPWSNPPVPVACNAEMRKWGKWVLAVATHYGFERRPGAQLGPAFNELLLERVNPAHDGPEPEMPT